MLSDRVPAAQRLDVSRLIEKFVAPAEARSPWLRYGLAFVLPCLGFLVTWQVFDLQKGAILYAVHGVSGRHLALWRKGAGPR